jgi:hypothetical protein
MVELLLLLLPAAAAIALLSFLQLSAEAAKCAIRQAVPG